jgi:hypothetical protein
MLGDLGGRYTVLTCGAQGIAAPARCDCASWRLAMAEADQKALKFRCSPELQDLIPRPIPAVLGLPDWFRAMPQNALSSIASEDMHSVKKCPPFIDAMTYGFLIPLAIDLSVHDGEFSWNFEVPKGFVSEYALSPISFHDPNQVAGTPLFDDDRFIIKFNGFWTIQAPPGYSLLFTHPANRAELPFSTLTGLVDCDAFHDVPIHFPARWHDVDFNGVLPKGTPIAQCIPVKRENWTGQFESLTAEAMTHMIEMKERLARESDIYRRHYRAPKR